MNKQNNNEETLLKAFHSDDPSTALSVLFERYADSIYRLALGLLREPLAAEDVVQETFLSAITHRHQFEGRSKLSTWLYRIAYNASRDKLRKKTEEFLPEEEAVDDDYQNIPMPKSMIEWNWSPEEMLTNNEAKNEVKKAIQSLPQSLKAVFLLRDIEELSTEETAEALGLSIGAVKVRLHRARLALREQLSTYFEERVSGA